MKLLKANTFFTGKDHNDMVNNTLNTNIKQKIWSTVDLKETYNYGITAWYVFMDGKPHGPTKEYKFKNYISEDQKTIKEIFVGTEPEQVLKWRKTEGFLPIRLAFQIDPYKENNKYKCKFIGVFAFSRFISQDLTSIEYKKISDEFILGTKVNDNVNTIKEYRKYIPKYDYPVENIDYPKGTKNIIKKFNINYAGELLELGTKNDFLFMQIIHMKLFEIFK